MENYAHEKNYTALNIEEEKLLATFLPEELLQHFCAEAWPFTQSEGKYDGVFPCPLVAPGHHSGICPPSYWLLAFRFLLACIDPLLLGGIQSHHARNADAEVRNVFFKFGLVKAAKVTSRQHIKYLTFSKIPK